MLLFGRIFLDSGWFSWCISNFLIVRQYANSTRRRTRWISAGLWQVRGLRLVGSVPVGSVCVYWHSYSEHDKVLGLLVYSLSSLDAVAIEICRHTTVLFYLEQFSSELYGTLKRNEKYLHRKWPSVHKNCKPGPTPKPAHLLFSRLAGVHT